MTTFRKITGLGLLLLFLVQSALFSAGSVFLCLHQVGDAHLVQTSADDCCHEPGDSISARAHICKGCTDLEFSPTVSVVWRETQRAETPTLLHLQTWSPLVEKPDLFAGHAKIRSTRAPPLVETMARLHTRTVRWLV